MAREQGLRSTPALAQMELPLKKITDVYHLGVYLEVPEEQLTQFEKDYPHDTARQRTKVLTYWLNNCSDATWERLAAAVENVGGHGNLVRWLRDLALESSRQDNDVADDDVAFSTPPESPVASDHSHMEDINIFERISALRPVAAVAADKLDESSLALATKKLTLDFTSLFTSVRLSLEKLQVTPESVLSHLKSIEAIAPDIECVYVSKAEKFEKTLSKTVKSLEDLFPAIAPYCSWFNHLLVENIIETFCEDDDNLLQKWEKFKEKRAEYCKSRVYPCQPGKSDQHADTTPVVMKIDSKWKTVKFSQLEVIRDTVAQILEIKPHNLHLQAVKNGCIELTFSIPSFIAIRCLPPSAEQITALRNEGVSFIQYARVWALAIGDADDLREVMMKRVREVEVREKTAESAGKDVEIHQLQQELEHEQAERTRAEEQLQQKDAEIQNVNSELQQTRAQLQQKARDLEIKQAELTRAEEQFEIVNTKLQQAESQLEQKAQKDKQLDQLESDLTQTRAQVQQQAAELDSVQQSFQSLRAELEERVARSRAQAEEMQQRCAEINRLMEELRKCQTGLQRQQKLLSELEDTEAWLNPLEKELQRQIDKLDGFMKERSHLEKQSEKLLAISKSEERDAKVAMSKLKKGKEPPLPQHKNPSGMEDKGQLTKQTPLAELKIPLKLEWRRGRDMPFSMSGHIQAVVIGSDVYVGGGDGSIQHNATVMVYSVQTGSWRTLPPHETFWFGMAAVNNQLVLVGGRSTSTREATNVLVAWDERSQRWIRPYPVMPTARHSLSATSYQKWLIVAGGEDRGSRLNEVELLDTVSGQWYEGSPLPTERSLMSSAINGNMWYLSGGWSSQGANEHVFSVCLDVLISQAVSESAGSTLLPWQTLPEAQLTDSTIFILNGALLTVGGWGSSSIHLYQPGRRSWVKVGDLPNKQWQCACAVLPNGEMFVAGGHSYVENKHMYNYIATVVIDNQ